MTLHHPPLPFDTADLEPSHSGLVSGFQPQTPPPAHICKHDTHDCLQFKRDTSP